MPRSLHLVNAWLPRTETFVWQVLRRLSEFPPTLLADRYEHESEFPLPAAEFLRLPPRRGAVARALARLAGGYAPVSYRLPPPALGEPAARAWAVAHAHGGYRALVAASFLKGMGLPWIAHFYGSDVSQRAFLRRARRGYARVFREASALLAEGPAMRDRLLALGAPAEKIRIQRLSLSLDDYRFRAREWKGDRPLQVLFVGRCVGKKGLDVALRALAQGPTGASAFDGTLTVIGDGPLRAEWESLASRCGLAGKVRFAGSQSLSEVRRALEGSDLLVQPSRRAEDGDGEGGAPTILLEAQACGLPVLSTFHDDIPQAVRHGETGWLVAENDVEAWRLGWEKILSEAPRWEAMGRAGRRHVETEFNAETNVAELETLYRKLAGGKAA